MTRQGMGVREEEYAHSFVLIETFKAARRRGVDIVKRPNLSVYWRDMISTRPFPPPTTPKRDEVWQRRPASVVEDTDDMVTACEGRTASPRDRDAHTFGEGKSTDNRRTAWTRATCKPSPEPMDWKPGGYLRYEWLLQLGDLLLRAARTRPGLAGWLAAARLGTGGIKDGFLASFYFWARRVIRSDGGVSSTTHATPVCAEGEEKKRRSTGITVCDVGVGQRVGVSPALQSCPDAFSPLRRWRLGSMGLLMLKNVEAALGGSRGRRHPVPGPHPHFPGAKCKVSYMYAKRSTCTGPSWQEPREELGKSEGRQAEQLRATRFPEPLLFSVLVAPSSHGAALGQARQVSSHAGFPRDALWPWGAAPTTSPSLADLQPTQTTPRKLPPLNQHSPSSPHMRAHGTAEQPTPARLSATLRLAHGTNLSARADRSTAWLKGRRHQGTPATDIPNWAARWGPLSSRVGAEAAVGDSSTCEDQSGAPHVPGIAATPPQGRLQQRTNRPTDIDCDRTLLCSLWGCFTRPFAAFPAPANKLAILLEATAQNEPAARSVPDLHMIQVPKWPLDFQTSSSAPWHISSRGFARSAPPVTLPRSNDNLSWHNATPGDSEPKLGHSVRKALDSLPTSVTGSRPAVRARRSACVEPLSIFRLSRPALSSAAGDHQPPVTDHDSQSGSRIMLVTVGHVVIDGPASAKSVIFAQASLVALQGRGSTEYGRTERLCFRRTCGTEPTPQTVTVTAVSLSLTARPSCLGTNDVAYRSVAIVVTAGRARSRQYELTHRAQRRSPRRLGPHDGGFEAATAVRSGVGSLDALQTIPGNKRCTKARADGMTCTTSGRSVRAVKLSAGSLPPAGLHRTVLGSSGDLDSDTVGAPARKPVLAPDHVMYEAFCDEFALVRQLQRPARMRNSVPTPAWVSAAGVPGRRACQVNHPDLVSLPELASLTSARSEGTSPSGNSPVAGGRQNDGPRTLVRDAFGRAFAAQSPASLCGRHGPTLSRRAVVPLRAETDLQPKGGGHQKNATMGRWLSPVKTGRALWERLYDKTTADHGNLVLNERRLTPSHDLRQWNLSSCSLGEKAGCWFRQEWDRPEAQPQLSLSVMLTNSTRSTKLGRARRNGLAESWAKGGRARARPTGPLFDLQLIGDAACKMQSALRGRLGGNCPAPGIWVEDREENVIYDSQQSPVGPTAVGCCRSRVRNIALEREGGIHLDSGQVDDAPALATHARTA
ncbi:hypothetical protein PCL_05893 [Purpureocillium lilacinum]|uniref:Uncharacterized protein n=1 Tax=Purpureocillium lilacinum TaxID=33203 RepID=A0A2U3EL48_PURLI|nr:hypothetical protein PCL_05893 [Purpureocillium lilacinum]